MPEWPPPPPPSYDNAMNLPHHLFADEYSYDYVIRTVKPRFIARYDPELQRDETLDPADADPLDIVQWLDPRPPTEELRAVLAEIARDYSYHKRVRDGRL